MANCVTTNKCCFRGRGKIKLGLYDPCCGIDENGDPVAYPLLDFGNASDFTVNATVTDTEQKDYQTAGGISCSVTEIDSVTISLTGRCLGPENFARQYAGTSAAKAASAAATFSGRIVAKGQYIPFKDAQGRVVTNIDTTSVIVTAPSGLVLGVDYTVSGNGITITQNAPNLPVIPALGLVFTATYEHGAYSLVEILTATTQEFVLAFDGFNAVDGSPFSGMFYRIKPKPNGGIPLISDDLASFNFEATVLKDLCVTAQGASQYGTFALV